MADVAAWMRVAEGVIGMFSIYLGYRLFCDVATERRRFLTNLASGALLGLFGLASFIAATTNYHPRDASLRGRGTTRSLNAPGIHRYGRTAQRTV
jgi:hypothetical protein